jgi:hypothetical protein
MTFLAKSMPTRISAVKSRTNLVSNAPTEFVEQEKPLYPVLKEPVTVIQSLIEKSLKHEAKENYPCEFHF